MKAKTLYHATFKTMICVMAAVALLLVVGCGFDDSTNLKLSDEEILANEVPKFSSEGGFYDAPFILTLSSAQDNTIYYTMDGSDPRSSDTAMEYTEGISIYNNTDEPNVYSALSDISLLDYNPPQYDIDKCITVRAVIKDSKDEFGEVITNSYFVGKDAPYYSEMKVISMVTDKDYLFHQDFGVYMVGSQYYEWKNSAEFVEYNPGDVLNVTNYNIDGRESEFPVSIQVFERGEAVYSADVGARIAGNWSRAHAQKSFCFYARKDYGVDKMEYGFFEELTDVYNQPISSFDKVILRNGGNDVSELHFRDALIRDLTEALSFDTLAAEPCTLFVNGEFWGFYMIREKTDGDYIESHYGIPKEAVAVIKNGGIEEGTDKDLEEFRQFCIWAASADMTNEENYKKFCDSMDVQCLMDYVAVETYINNNDWANGVSNNWQVWRSKVIDPNIPKADGVWRFILFDTDYSTGLYDSSVTNYDADWLNWMSAGKEDFNIPNIVRNLCKNDEFRQAFYDNYIRVMETCFETDAVIEKIDEYVAAYGEAITATNNRFGLDWVVYRYEDEVEELKNFFRCRPEYAKQYLDMFCGVEQKE